MPPTIPTTEELAAMTDAELAALLEQFTAWFNERRTAAVESGNPSDEDVEVLSNTAEAITALRGVSEARATEAAARIERIEALASQVVAADPDEDEGGEGEGDEGEAGDGGETTTTTTTTTPAPSNEAPTATATPPALAAPVATPPAAVAASVTPARRPSITSLRERTPANRAPVVAAAAPQRVGTVSITAAADIPGRTPGSTFANLREIAEAMIERHHALGRSSGGGEDDVPIARFNLELPDERTLNSRMATEEIEARLARFDQEPALVAAGGLCAPTAGYYEQMVIADTARPVRDALANFGADRGGIRFNPPPTLASITSGVAVITEAQDVSGTIKACFTVTCPSITEVRINAIYNCLTFGNFSARTFPEGVAAWSALALALQARTAEQKLLDLIAAASIATTSAGLVGAGREVFARLGQAGAGYRSRNRMDPEAVLTVLAPMWVLALIRADFARSFTDEPGLLGITDAEIEALFRDRYLDVHWYLDSKSGGSQIFGTQSAGVLNEFPSTGYFYLFAPGSFLHLDGGTLDLGLVRDSTLNSANQFRVFTETFENVAFVGVESLEVAIAFQPTGSFSAGVTVTSPIVT